ncbi:MAG: acylneuraminate cytidylyltransferase family protein [Pseudomonadota bacterium]
MYKNNRILALIPARSGSKGIPKKNTKMLLDKPLIAYTIHAALDAKCFDDIVVSTDSPEIATIANQYGAATPFLRPEYLSSDTAKAEDTIFHAIKELSAQNLHFDILVYLQPTSPLRDSQDIRNAVDFFIQHNLDSLASISSVEEHPLFMRTMDENHQMQKVLNSPSNVRRQDLQPYYILNGAIYINTVRMLNTDFRANDNTYGYILSAESGLDINTLEDFEKATTLLKCKMKAQKK